MVQRISQTAPNPAPWTNVGTEERKHTATPLTPPPGGVPARRSIADPEGRQPCAKEQISSENGGDERKRKSFKN